MKYRMFATFLAAAGFALAIGYLLSLPLVYTITFSAEGYQGDEDITLTKNWDSSTLLPRTVLGKAFRKLSVTTWAPVLNLRLHYLEPNSVSPPRYTTILFGVVRVSRRNLLGNLVDESDWMNLRTEYRSPTGQNMFKAPEPNMETVRSGITGWPGYYNMLPPIY